MQGGSLRSGTFRDRDEAGDAIVFSASVALANPSELKRKFDFYVAKAAKITTYHEQLVHCADLLKQDRGGHKMITAGFSWLYTGLLRETLEALPGLTLYANGDKAEFEEILDNLIADNQERLFHRTTQVEAPLRLADTLGRYIGFGADPKVSGRNTARPSKALLKVICRDAGSRSPCSRTAFSGRSSTIGPSRG